PDLIRVAVFEGKQIRKIMHEGEWWFSIVDIVAALTDSNIPKRYWSDLKRKLNREGFSELYDKIVQLRKFLLRMGKNMPPTVPILKPCFVSFSPFLHPRSNH
ncbi:MAG: hypothetical protein Q7U64_14945, partial [Desulfocapsaceae bacterium]|nr:hypothetical protein [Desulfocapsaceae bacterium]